MNKYDLARVLSSRLSLKQKDSLLYLNTLLEVVSEELSEGDKIMLQGFGTFARWEQTERIGRNPRTGSICLIRPRNSVKFKPGKFLLQKLNREV